MTIQIRILIARGDDGMTDSHFESCIALIRQGSAEGLKEIYECYYKLIYSIMLSVVKNREDAEDLTADLFLKLWDKLADSYRSGGGHKAWLGAVARNMATDHIRRKVRIQEVPIDRPSDEDSPYIEPVSSENIEDTVIGDMTVSEALKALDDTEREIVNFKLFADFTFQQISDTLSIPLGTVTWKYRNAINKLSNYIKEVQKND